MFSERINIGVVSPYKEFAKTATSVADKLGVAIDIKDVELEKLEEVIRKWEEEGIIEAIVARSAGASLMKKINALLPVITVELENINLAEAVFKARLSGSNSIAVVDNTAYRLQFNYDLIKVITNTNFHYIPCDGNSDIPRILAKAKTLEISTIVGTWLPMVEEADRKGFQALLVHCSDEKIEKAINEAWAIAKLRRYDKKDKLKLTAILNNVNDCIVVIDQNGIISICNPAAEQVLNVNGKVEIGQNLKQLSPGHVLHQIYDGGKECLNKLVDHKGKLLMVDRKNIEVPGLDADTVITFESAEHITKSEKRIRTKLHTRGLVTKYGFQDIIGKSESIKQCILKARKYAHSDAIILITGESGTGKELFAHGIHRASRRSKGPFVTVSCGTIPKSLMESELFGYEEGAFTGAKKGGKPGVFELAHGGTIFLDEIGELSLYVQARLLRVLQEQEVFRVGGKQIIPIDVRVIAATNRDLLKAVNEKRFRLDLFYRFNVLHLKIPTLRERISDAPLLFNIFLRGSSKRLGVTCPQVSAEHLKKLTGYNWPGNVRELQNFVERYVALGEADCQNAVTFNALLDEFSENNRLLKNDHSEKLSISLGTLKEMERQIVMQAYEKIPNSKAELAKTLGISRQALWRKLKQAKEEGDL